MLLDLLCYVSDDMWGFYFYFSCFLFLLFSYLLPRSESSIDGIRGRVQVFFWGGCLVVFFFSLLSSWGIFLTALGWVGLCIALEWVGGGLRAAGGVNMPIHVLHRVMLDKLCTVQ